MQQSLDVLDFLFNRGGFGERAGTLGLKTLAASATFPIIPLLGDGPGRLAMLGCEGEPEPDALAAEQDEEDEYEEYEDEDEEDDDERGPPPGPAATRAIHLAGVAELWLMDSPCGELRWGDRGAREATLALADGWASTIVHRLAAGPRTPEQLEASLPDLDGEEIEPCLWAMVRNGLLEPCAGRDGDAYALTAWGRAGVASLIAAARLERIAVPADPIEEIDVQATFALALSALRLPGERSGTCALTVDLGDLDNPDPCGGTVAFGDGRLTGWSLEEGDAPDARVIGAVDGWFRAVIEGHPDRLAVEGDVDLAGAILEGLYQSMFAIE